MIKAGETGWLIKQTPSGKVRISEVSVSMYSGDRIAVRGRKGAQRVPTAHNDEWTRLVTWIVATDLFATREAALAEQTRRHSAAA
jgi:hypothetical protein